MMYHLFHNYMWKVVRIAKTSDCKILVKTEVLSTVCMYLLYPKVLYRLSEGQYNKSEPLIAVLYTNIKC